MAKNKILIIDDEPDIRELLEITLVRMGLATLTAGSVTEALQCFQNPDDLPDLCLTDMKLPDGSGIDIVNYVQTHCPEIPIAVITAFGSMETAVSALKAGAIDFISKPVELKQLRDLVQSALNGGETAKDDAQQQDNRKLSIIGSSAAVESLKNTIKKISRGHAPVYIHGESGSGKELVAQSIHELGVRHDKPFVPVNCGAIPEQLMESEFFGHKKGSFTGAVSDKQGLFQVASGGTLFLDEVADLPLDMQVKLLRAIQEKSVKPIGGTEEIAVDIRILSATHKSLEVEVAAGRFRQDLYYRLNVIKIDVPPLRVRGDDILLLATHFLKKITQRWKIDEISLSEAARQAIRQYPFPGNVRELVNILERAVTLCEGDVIEVDDLQLSSLENKPAMSAAATAQASTTPETSTMSWKKGEISASEERQIIENALEINRWNRTRAAEQLGMTLRQLRYRIQKYDLEKYEANPA